MKSVVVATALAKTDESKIQPCEIENEKICIPLFTKTLRNQAYFPSLVVLN